NGNSKLYLSNYCGSHSLIDDPAEANGETVEVETIRLDSVLGLERIDVLKIDVEGLEIEVIKSLGSFRPKIILEYFSERVMRSGLDGPSFVKILHELGYTNLKNLDSPSSGIAPIIANEKIVVNLLASTDP
ncbi:MAG: FkbM family methyltransferase, partial [Verrucomicrobiota bacterium]